MHTPPVFKSADELEPSGWFQCCLPSALINPFSLQYAESSRGCKKPGSKIRKHVYTCYICSGICRPCFTLDSLCRHPLAIILVWLTSTHAPQSRRMEVQTFATWPRVVLPENTVSTFLVSKLPWNLLLHSGLGVS